MRALVDQVRRFAGHRVERPDLRRDRHRQERRRPRAARAGPRARRPFVVVDCAALTTTLIDSELFGHERGAFTDAVAARPGRFELASNGTVYLDAVTELSIEAQGKLLRIVEEKRVERLGGQTSLAVPARVVASADSGVEDAVREGRFRGDRFTASACCRSGSRRCGSGPKTSRRWPISSRPRRRRRQPGGAHLAPDVLTALRDYAWPGNVRELKHVVERALAAVDRGVLTLRHLPQEILEGAALKPDALPGRRPTLDEVERRATSRPRSSTPAATRRRRHSCSASAGRPCGRSASGTGWSNRRARRGALGPVRTGVRRVRSAARLPQPRPGLRALLGIDPAAHAAPVRRLRRSARHLAKASTASMADARGAAGRSVWSP